MITHYSDACPVGQQDLQSKIECKNYTKSSALPENPASELNRLVDAFKAIGREKSEFKRYWWLGKVAGYHGLAKAECRRLFVLWALEANEINEGGEV